MIRIGKVYIDSKGAGRLYISEPITKALGWKDHDRIVIKQKDGQLEVSLESDMENEVKP